jgi:hypothetical protein
MVAPQSTIQRNTSAVELELEGCTLVNNMPISKLNPPSLSYFRSDEITWATHRLLGEMEGPIRVLLLRGVRVAPCAGWAVGDDGRAVRD